VIGIAIGLALAFASPPGPEETVNRFLELWLKSPTNDSHLKEASALDRFFTKHLQRVLNDADACQADWGSQQPSDSTDKPPFVDCCVFASSPEGIPKAFTVGRATVMPDGRWRVVVRYTYTDPPGTYADPTLPLGTWSWDDAFIVARAGGEYLLDDFVYMGQHPGEEPLLLSERFGGCQGAKWVGH
jgi:hypothetical protein